MEPTARGFSKIAPSHRRNTRATLQAELAAIQEQSLQPSTSQEIDTYNSPNFEPSDPQSPGRYSELSFSGLPPLTPSASDSDSEPSPNSLEKILSSLPLKPPLNPNLNPVLNPLPPVIMATALPPRGERGAPIFDSRQPLELGRFFSDLEFLFTPHTTLSNEDKKKHAVRYLNMEDEIIWTSLAEYSNVAPPGGTAPTWAQFKDAIYNIYPAASKAHCYNMGDLDMLVGNRQRVGISSLHDLAEYHRTFKAISMILISANATTLAEVQRAYIRGFTPTIWIQIINRLQHVIPGLSPTPPYDIDQVYEAAKWVIQSNPFAATSITGMYLPQAPVPMISNPPQTNMTPSSQPTPEPVKEEPLSAVIAELRELRKEFRAAQVERPSNSSGGGSYNNSSGRSRNTNYNNCNFCGGEHYFRECTLVDEYIQAGKCKRNVDGKLILPGGGFIPSNIPGRLLKDRFDEWHKRNPGQLAAGTLFHSITKSLQTTPSSERNQSFQLSTEDRIASIKAELYNLERSKNKFVPTIRTRAQRNREQESNDEEEISRHTSETPAPQHSHPPQQQQPRVQRQQPAQLPAPGNTRQVPAQVPEHPFRNAQDAAYSPPNTRNIGAPADRTTANRRDPAYRTLPPIHDSELANKVYDRSLNAPVTLTQRELLSLSPEVRSQYREATTTRRQPVRNTQETAANIQFEEELQELQNYQPDNEQDIQAPSHSASKARGYHRLFAKYDPNVVYPHQANEHDHKTFSAHVPTPTYGDSAFNHLMTVGEQPQFLNNSIIIPDTYDTYYKSLSPGEKPDPNKLVVSLESSALRSIHPLVDNALHVEAILDPGSSIIAMSEAVSKELSLSYDPDVTLRMQSANGTVNWSLGLARNVPFLIGDLSFYLQVHIIRNPAYNILLGRPFDVLTTSTVQNFADEDQTITIHCPNTGQSATVPTTPRNITQIPDNNNELPRHTQTRRGMVNFRK